MDSSFVATILSPPIASYTLGCVVAGIRPCAVGETFPPAIDAHATQDYVSKPGYVLYNPHSSTVFLSRFSLARSFHRVNSLQDRAITWSIAPSSLSCGPMHLHSAKGGRNRLNRYAVSNSYGTSIFLLKVDCNGPNEVVLHEVDGA